MPRNQLILLTIGLLLFPVLTFAQLQPPQSNTNTWTTDEEGRRFRVTFPRHDRVSVLASTLPAQDIGGWRFALEPKIELEADFADEEIWWRLRHRIISAAFTTAVPVPNPNLEIEIVRGRYLRHDLGSYILIPIGGGDIKLPAPFDIAIDYRFGKLNYRAGEGDLLLKRLDVVEFAPMADWIRDNEWRHRFAVGPVARYRISVPTEGVSDHQFVPFTGGRILYGYETRNGIFAFRLNTDVFNETRGIIDEPLRRAWVIETRGNVEWIPFAINNQPVSVVGRGSLHWEDGDLDTQFDVGLRLSFSLQ